MSAHADQFERETGHDPAGDELREEQEGKGYGEDEGERERGPERDDESAS